MKPENVLSPRRRITPGSLSVILTRPEPEYPDRSWSLAEMEYDGKLRVGCRWNGITNDPNSLGHPRSHGQAAWFILPDEIGWPLADMIKRNSEAPKARPDPGTTA